MDHVQDLIGYLVMRCEEVLERYQHHKNFVALCFMVFNLKFIVFIANLYSPFSILYGS